MRNIIPKSPLILFAVLYLFRLLNAFCVTNLLFPDEWWQFSEPAHVAVYGYGYLTWDWRAGIRSYVPILPMMMLMQVSKILGIREDWMARNGSKIVMAGWMALTDLYTYKLAGKLFGTLIAPYALLFSLTSSFHASRSIRSLSNNLEMALTTVALFYAPANNKSGNFRAMLSIVGLSCLARVTTVMFWLTPGLVVTLRFVSWRDRLISTPLIILATIIIGLAIDSYFYGKFTVTWWNFYKWNVLKKVSEYYGRESAVYHLKVTLPLMLNTSFGYFGMGMWRGAWRREWNGLTMLVFLVLSSMQTHKETRFLAPVYPLLLICTAYGAQQVNVLVSKKHWPLKLLSRLALLSVILSNILIGWFYARVHYKGAYEILDKLNGLTRDSDASVYFLTPCHVLPFEGYLHREEVKMDFLKCHPKAVDELMPAEESNSRDHFNRDPIGFVDDVVISEGYSHLILYENDLDKYIDLFKGKYEECARVQASKILKRRGDLLIYCKK